MIKTVLSAMNGGFLQTLKLFAVTLAGLRTAVETQGSFP